MGDDPVFLDSMKHVHIQLVSFVFRLQDGDTDSACASFPEGLLMLDKATTVSPCPATNKACAHHYAVSMCCFWKRTPGLVSILLLVNRMIDKLRWLLYQARTSCCGVRATWPGWACPARLCPNQNGSPDTLPCTLPTCSAPPPWSLTNTW